jgi:L-fuculose-phosphate aldolase
VSDNRIRATVADYARRLHARGWVANHDGNVTARLGPQGTERYLATPTAVSKAEIEADSLIVVDEGGARVSGGGKPFGEIGLHLTVYRSRSDVNAVVHAHPPTATGFAVAGVGLDRPIIAEAVVSLGVGVPTVPFAAPGEAACRALAGFVGNFDAVLIANHGVMAWGADVEQAYLRLELVEHLARIALVAQQLGGVRPLPDAVLGGLLESRRKAGLGQAASLARGDPPPKAVVACAPPPPGSDVVLVERPRALAIASPSGGPGDLASIIRQEIAAALKK